MPSLAPRPAESIDPRLPVPDRSGEIPLDATLAAGLQALVAQARATETPFEAAIAPAEQAAAAAGARDSESWITAQQALSGAIAARYPTTRALGDLDALSAARLKERGFIAPRDLAAIREAAEAIAAIDSRQAARVDAVQARLGG
ncbi:hypothetical protein [Sphingomonas arenae]|uniref:hypothetical protein n=1 Tax=Sphingomonas arenae TaxID=2812555 RepID=UPI00196788C6|nr:hypothetical protein [Sphingomonas arenae]